MSDLVILYGSGVVVMALLIRVVALRQGNLDLVDKHAAALACFLWPGAVVIFALAGIGMLFAWAFFSAPEDQA